MGQEVKGLTMLQARENMYRFLARLYVLEVDAELLGALRVMDFPAANGNAELEAGYRLMESAVAKLDADGLDELAVDYARVFLAAGVAEGGAAFPYESAYTSRQRISHQKAKGAASATYAAEGLSMAEGLPRIPEDHAAAELDFMAYLCGSAQLDAACLPRQQEFFRTHIQSWMTRFALDVVKYAESDFYKALGRITAGFLQMEKEYLHEMEAEWQTASKGA